MKLSAFKTDLTSIFLHDYADESLLLALSLSAYLSPCFVVVPFSIHRLIFFFHRSNMSSLKTLLVQHVFDWPAHYFIKATFRCIKYSLARKKKFSLPLRRMCQDFIWVDFARKKFRKILLLKEWHKHLQMRCSTCHLRGSSVYLS